VSKREERKKKNKQNDERKFSLFELVVKFVKNNNVTVWGWWCWWKYHWTSHAWPTFWRAVFLFVGKYIFFFLFPPHITHTQFIRLLSFSLYANLFEIVCDSLIFKFCNPMSDTKLIIVSLFYFMKSNFPFVFLVLIEKQIPHV
jgi:hypothetical protein